MILKSQYGRSCQQHNVRLLKKAVFQVWVRCFTLSGLRYFVEVVLGLYEVHCLITWTTPGSQGYWGRRFASPQRAHRDQSLFSTSSGPKHHGVWHTSHGFSNREAHHVAKPLSWKEPNSQDWDRRYKRKWPHRARCLAAAPRKWVSSLQKQRKTVFCFLVHPSNYYLDVLSSTKRTEKS